MKQQIKHGIPALFSFFFSGLGQIIKGDWAKFWQIWIYYFIALSPTFLFFTVSQSFQGIFAVLAFLGWIATFIIWLWQIKDAYNN